MSKKISVVFINVTDTAFVRVFTGSRKNVGLDASMRKCSPLIFHEIYFTKIIVRNSITGIWKWIHVICGLVITDTFTIRVGAIFVTRVALIVVSNDFLLTRGPISLQY